MRRTADITRVILGIAPDRRVSVILIPILKSQEKLSYWDLIKHFDRHPDDLELCELSRSYYTSWYHFRISEIDPAILQKIITRMASDDTVHDTLLVDSSGFSISMYENWQNAKLSVRQFCKLHIMYGMRRCRDMANDSPHLRAIAETLPEGDGDVLADAAYGGVQNCNAIRDSGRRYIVDTTIQSTPD